MQKFPEIFPTEQDLVIKINLCHLWHPAIEQMIGKFTEVLQECLEDLRLNSGTRVFRPPAGTTDAGEVMRGFKDDKRVQVLQAT